MIKLRTYYQWRQQRHDHPTLLLSGGKPEKGYSNGEQHKLNGNLSQLQIYHGT